MKTSAILTVAALVLAVSCMAVKPTSTPKPTHKPVPTPPPTPPPMPVPPCHAGRNVGRRFCDPRLSLDERLDDLVNSVPMNNYTGTLMRDNSSLWEEPYLPQYWWLSDSLHGVAYSPALKLFGNVTSSTSFPMPCLMSASFDKDLYDRVPSTIGMEARAMSNLGHTGLTYWSPNSNIYRDPRWGRGMETPGEDPFLTMTYLERYVKGMQNSPLDASRLQTSAMCKHFLGYSMDDSDGTTRFVFNAVINEYDLNHTYLPVFEACVSPHGAAATAMMCSYNAVNGIPSCVNEKYMNGIAREQWGFDGYITADCDAAYYVVNGHHFLKSGVELLRRTLNAGMDMGCYGWAQDFFAEALAERKIDASMVRRSLRRMWKVWLRLGYFDPIEDQPLKELGVKDINSPYAQKLAIDSARGGMAMLKFDRDYLPLDGPRKHFGTRPVVLGPNANATKVMIGNYYGKPPYIVSAYDGIQQYAPDATLFSALDKVLSLGVENYTEACELIRTHTTGIVVVGNDVSVENEMNDRRTISLPGNQNIFVRRMAACAAEVGKKIAVVVMSGGSIDYSAFNKLAGVGAVMWAGYGGQNGGTAIADILYGTVSPSGRLPHTAYPAAYADEVLMTDMQMTPNATTGNPGRTYRYYTGEAVYPFGHGLSYSNFTARVVPSSSDVAYGRAKLRAFDPSRPAYTQQLGEVHVNVTNIGDRAAAFSLLFTVVPDPPGPETGGQLSDFTKVFLQPGESTVATLGIHAHAVRDQLSSQPQAFRWTIKDLLDGRAVWYTE